MRLFKQVSFVLFYFVLNSYLPLVRADQIILKNGDRIAGGIIKKEDSKLTIKSEQMGIVVTSWEQVDALVIEQPVYILHRNGHVFHGTLTMKNGTEEVRAPQSTDALAASDIASIRNQQEENAYQRMLHPGWGSLWVGTGTLGFAGTAGNAKTATFTIAVKADRVTHTDKTSLYFNFIKASASVNDVSEDTAEAIRGGFSYGHNINTRLFVSAFNDYEYDRFQNLDLRFVIGGGLGFHAWKSDRNRLDLVAGASYNRSKFSTPLIRNSAELYWGNDYTLKLNSATSLTQSYRMFNDLTNTGSYRVNFDAGINAKLFKWLTWNISLSDRYLSDPAPGRKTNDFLYTTGLGISFSR